MINFWFFSRISKQKHPPSSHFQTKILAFQEENVSLQTEKINLVQKGLKMDTEKNITNQENHEDKSFNVGELVSSSEQFLEKNRKVIIIILAVVVLGIGGFFAYKYLYAAPREKNASAELFAAQQYFQNEDFEKALKGDGKHGGLLNIIDEYGSTKSGKLASYYAGVIYLQKGEYQKAIDYLSDFSTDDVFMKYQTKALLGDAYAELNQLDKAISYYKEAVKGDNDLSTPFVLMKMGQIYEMQNKNKEALDCYKQIKKDYPSSMEYREVEKYISRIEAL